MLCTFKLLCRSVFVARVQLLTKSWWDIWLPALRGLLQALARLQIQSWDFFVGQWDVFVLTSVLLKRQWNVLQELLHIPRESKALEPT